MDNLMELGRVIASRSFESERGSIELLIGLPRPYDDGTDYFCPFQLRGIGDEKVRSAGGVDALQALILGIDRAAMYLSGTPEVRDGRLTFLGNLGIGFGPPTP
ncbi:hypothetical protein [Luteibacter sp. UNC138MFCol5.1]|uniref:DUF6968 family protein n=1 Tax=Luteibacter sp. UNC138MFCol5.1 TaxID=1502774 RepID=UPI0011608A3B|nr:hypothetical protein [Luteibacter sp. UNC138MFCol5.1]